VGQGKTPIPGKHSTPVHNCDRRGVREEDEKNPAVGDRNVQATPHGLRRLKRREMMEKTKKKRLEKKGWRIGSAAGFLDLTPEENRYIELKLALGEHLKRRRRSRKLSQETLAKLLSSSQSRVAKMEAADPSVSLDLLVRSLLSLGSSEKELAKVIASAGRVPPPAIGNSPRCDR
jgi:predicted XRE-type DNA-binding protein